MLIGELAESVGLPSQTIRFYEREGLLPPARRGANGYRVYGETTLNRLGFIRAAQQLASRSERSGASSISATSVTCRAGT